VRISERLLTVLVCCLLAAAIPAFGSGKGERELKQAQELLDGKQYSRAMALIVEIMKAYPDLREQADKLVARVMEVRKLFNEQYRELLHVLNVEQDVEKGLAIIKKLEDLDPNPDPAVKRSIAAAQRALLRTGEFQRFATVMEEAAVQMSGGKMADAIRTYLGGFAISRAEFDLAPYSSLHREQALATVRSLEEASQRAAASQNDTAALPAALEALVKQPVTESVREAFLGTLQPLAQAREREAQIRALAVRVREVNAAIDAANGDIEPDDLWLHFVELYALGRPEMPPEGLAYAARQPWVSTVRTLSDTAVAASDAAYQAIEKGFAAGVPLAPLRALAGEARNAGLLAIAMLDAEAPAWKPTEGLALSNADAARAADLLTLAGRSRQHVADADAWEAFAVVEAAAADEIAALERSFTSVPSATVSDPNALLRGRTELAAIQESAGRREIEWSGRTEDAAPGSVIAVRAAAVADRFGSAAARALEADVGLAVRIAGLESAAFQTRYTEAQARQEKGRELAAGSAGGQAPVGRRPDLAREEYARSLSDLESLLGNIEGWRARWTSEPAPVSGSAGIARLLADQVDLRGRVVALQTVISGDDTVAATAIAMAAELRGQGDSAYSAAQTHEKERSYTEAQNEYETALTSYGSSLERQEHAATRSRYNDLPRLIAAVKQLLLRQTLADVEARVNRGIAEYKNTDFATAVATLEAAKAQWDASNPEPNDTLEYYLGLARSAQKLSGRREITRTDPIYEDVRGFMTQAELSYNEASRLKKSNPSSEEYARSIQAAKASVEAITTAVPEYREARLMDLKIERLDAGETAFAALLRQRVADALAKAKDPRATEVTMRDTRLSLMDYQGIEGITTILSASVRSQIAAAIVDLEVRLGMRAAATDPRLVARSADLYRQANAMYRRNPNDQTLWDPVLLLLRQSLAANPDNPEARTLRNEVIAKRGGSTEDLLSPAEQEQYLAAINAFARNDLPRAEAIVDALLGAKPKNPGLLTLKAQIQRARGE
jgi:tetratricopeptide (TPR) repeat protein